MGMVLFFEMHLRQTGAFHELLLERSNKTNAFEKNLPRIPCHRVIGGVLPNMCPKSFGTSTASLPKNDLHQDVGEFFEIF